MIRLYNKNRHRFSDPRGTSLKIFEKPIGFVGINQEKMKNKEHLVLLTNLFNNYGNLAPNYSLLPPSESGIKSEILSEDLLRQFLEKSCQPKSDQTGIISKSTGNLSVSQLAKISRTKILNLAEERNNHGKKGTSSALNLFIKYYMETKKP